MSWLIIVLVVAAVAALVVVALPQVRSAALRRGFGSEYDRVLEQQGDRRRAEAVLRERRERRAALQIRELEPGTVARYVEAWRQVQFGFVDDPGGAVASGHQLVREVMQERGYPVDRFEARAEMVSVDQADLVGGYRTAHAIEVKSRQGAVTLDDLRRAFTLYRALFKGLLATRSQAVEERVG